MSDMRYAVEDIREENTKLKSQIEKLKSENEKMRAELNKTILKWKYIKETGLEDHDKWVIELANSALAEIEGEK